MVVCVGSIDSDSTASRYGAVSKADNAALRAAGAVGDMLFNFFDIDGKLVDHSLNKRTMSIPVDTISAVPARILVAGGANKVAAMIGAFKLFRPTVLITDEFTAKALLKDTARKKARRFALGSVRRADASERRRRHVKYGSTAANSDASALTGSRARAADIRRENRASTPASAAATISVLFNPLASRRQRDHRRGQADDHATVEVWRYEQLLRPARIVQIESKLLDWAGVLRRHARSPRTVAERFQPLDEAEAAGSGSITDAMRSW